jgi:hypothetical protein
VLLPSSPFTREWRLPAHGLHASEHVSERAQALTVLSIVLVNVATERLIQYVTSFELHRTRTREGASMLSALFITQYINTGLSILIANAYMPRLQARAALHTCRLHVCMCANGYMLQAV